jgi:hypothetical protein
MAYAPELVEAIANVSAPLPLFVIVCAYVTCAPGAAFLVEPADKPMLATCWTTVTTVFDVALRGVMVESRYVAVAWLVIDVPAAVTAWALVP